MILFGRSCRYWNYGSSMVKNLPEMQEAQVRSLDQEDPLAEERAISSSIFAWKISWTEEPTVHRDTKSRQISKS